MNREQMIEKARHAILERRGPGKHRGAGLDAQAVVDAILPQVSTVEELEALPHYAALVNGHGDVDRAYSWLGAIAFTGRPDMVFPLTVVWQP